MLSYQEIGAAAILSRACAGVARGKIVIALPGSEAAVGSRWRSSSAPNSRTWSGKLEGSSSQRGHEKYLKAEGRRL